MSAKKSDRWPLHPHWDRFVQAVTEQGFDPDEHPPNEVLSAAMQWVFDHRNKPTATGFVVVHFPAGAFVYAAGGPQWVDLPPDVKGRAEMTWRKSLETDAAARHDAWLYVARLEQSSEEVTPIKSLFVEFTVMSDGSLELNIADGDNPDAPQIRPLLQRQAVWTQRYHRIGAKDHAHFIASQLNDRLRHELWQLLRGPRGGVRPKTGRAPEHGLSEAKLARFAELSQKYRSEGKRAPEARELAASKVGLSVGYGGTKARPDALRRLERQARELVKPTPKPPDAIVEGDRT